MSERPERGPGILSPVLTGCEMGRGALWLPLWVLYCVGTVLCGRDGNVVHVCVVVGVVPLTVRHQPAPPLH